MFLYFFDPQNSLVPNRYSARVTLWTIFLAAIKSLFSSNFESDFERVPPLHNLLENAFSMEITKVLPSSYEKIETLDADLLATRTILDRL